MLALALVPWRGWTAESHPILDVFAAMGCTSYSGRRGTQDSLHEFNSYALGQLVQRGYLNEHKGEFGDAEWTVNLELLHWVRRSNVSFPMYDITVKSGDAGSSSPRLSLILALAFAGWEPSAEEPPSFKPEGAASL